MCVDVLRVKGKSHVIKHKTVNRVCMIDWDVSFISVEIWVIEEEKRKSYSMSIIIDFYYFYYYSNVLRKNYSKSKL
jgi:hypothetical protein